MSEAQEFFPTPDMLSQANRHSGPAGPIAPPARQASNALSQRPMRTQRGAQTNKPHQRIPARWLLRKSMGVAPHVPRAHSRDRLAAPPRPGAFPPRPRAQPLLDRLRQAHILPQHPGRTPPCGCGSRYTRRRAFSQAFRPSRTRHTPAYPRVRSRLRRIPSGARSSSVSGHHKAAGPLLAYASPERAHPVRRARPASKRTPLFLTNEQKASTSHPT
jgi:hypothetical protein